MLNHTSLDDAIRSESELINAIKSDFRRRALPALQILVLTCIIPFVVLCVVWVVGGAIRTYFNDAYNDSFLNTTTNISVSLVLLAAMYFSARWAERRFGGLALVRHLAGVSSAVLKVEKALDAAKGRNNDDGGEVVALAHQAWDTYVTAMAAHGFHVDNSPAS
jgi:arginine exporter protein ArgO